MKKTISILFIVLLLFNVMGYYGLFLGLQYTNDVRMIQRLDSEDYDKSQIFTVKIPLTIPYATDSHDFERINGQFEHNGEFYRMVKQRLSRDTIYIVCLRDEGSKQINQALGRYVKTFTDKPVDSQSSIKTLPSFIKDYFARSISMSCSSAGWECELLKSTAVPFFISSFYPSIIHPPERG